MKYVLRRLSFVTSELTTIQPEPEFEPTARLDGRIRLLAPVEKLSRLIESTPQVELLA
jgi:hypothetical protein